MVAKIFHEAVSTQCVKTILRGEFMKIIVIGAGHGGLQTAKVLTKKGYDVSVFEKSPKNCVSYDWRDDVEPTVFEKLGIPIPQNSFRTDCPSLFAPLSDLPLYVSSEENTREWNLERTAFVHLLCDLAEKEGAKVFFEKKVERLILENNAVKGVVVDGENIYADLVIDSSGLDSPFRGEIPQTFGITKSVKSDEAFTVYRAYVQPREGVEKPEKHARRVYLKFLGQPGIAWCICEPDGVINILVGQVGGMSEVVLNSSLSELKKLNPIIGDKVLRGGQVVRIPVRYPLTKMVAKGYVVIGDSACMTVPMIGSGISNSLRAGQILGEEIIKANSVSLETLWNYQVRYYLEIGAEHFMIDSLKRMLLKADNEDIKYMFESGAITEEDMHSMTAGGSLKLTPKSIMNKVCKGIKKFGFLVKFGITALKGMKAQKLAKKIPTVYNEKKINKWQRKLEKKFN